METHALRPWGVTLIAIVNAIATVITLAFWLLVWQRLSHADLPVTLDQAAVASTLGFVIADLVWAIPLLIVSVPGLWRLQAWGWTTAQLANLLWIYPLTAAWTRDLYLGSISPGNVLFLPFAIFAMWAIIYLWQMRDLFWIKE